MPFEQGSGLPRKIAIIGGGISGMGAANLLADHHNVILFEAEPRLGGHARTRIAGKRGDRPVDTGFIVFNKVTYPNLVQLFDRLEVPIIESRMSFGVSARGGAVEYALHGADALFAQRRNLVQPNFLRMVRDLYRFNAQALRYADDRSITVRDLLDRLGTGSWFRSYYLEPFSGAIWSTPKEKVLDFPAHAMIRFFDNHLLLDARRDHQWYTVQGGSVEYVRRLEAAMRRKGGEIRLGAPIDAVRRTPAGPQVKASGGDWETFDEVVFATHSDDTLSLLADPTPQERAALGAIRYQPNDVVLHADPSLMPKRRKCWASWVHTEDAAPESSRIDLTYWMNSLQPIPQDDPMFVTLNSRRRIREELIYDEAVFRHPVFDLAALDAQQEVARFNGANATWFCGAWMRNGFHEDGLASAVDVVEGINRAGAIQVAAE
ncbi:FAD-dependent oxidoreductase [Ruegeria sediminis]|uniref:FAD-dependent oxidoreductase n=1 Tax=Ruegeria sediminis TaxID=2583820 RepID=A0ABY2WU36_9RHOB|nr:FAD-dependent oxidoreductase [Ruegeria sediminis]TMV04810.1 FAD-dependent oxidoreductase [Ruegeria sediminis]